MAGILETAIRHHREGRVAEALELYELALETDPHPQADLRYLAGAAYLATGRIEDAERNLSLAAALAPSRADIQAAYGNALYTLQRHGDALAVFRRAAALSPEAAPLWFNLGNAARACGDAEAAVEGFRKALALEPGHAPALINLGTLLLDEARLDDFRNLMRQVHAEPALNPRFCDLAKVGLLKTASRREQSLKGMLETLFAAHPEDGRIAWMLGYGAFLARNFAKAENYLEKAVALSPLPEAGLLLGLLLGANADQERAVPHLAAADPEALLVAADLFLTLEASEARRAAMLEAVRAAHPGDWRVLHHNLFHAMGARRHTTAIAILKQLMTTTGQDFRSIESRALSPMQQQDTLALAYFTEAVKTYAAADFVSFLTLSVLMGRNDLHGAIRAGARAVDLRPDDVEAVLNLARLTDTMDKPGAIGLLKESLERVSYAPEILNYLGNLCLRIGRVDEAARYHDMARARIGPEAGEKLEWQLLASNYRGDLAAETVAGMHRMWGNGLQARLGVPRRPVRAALEGRRLRVGYVSGDFKNTSPSYFMLPLLQNHDRARVEIYCYATQEHDDEVTLRFKQLAERWANIEPMADDEAAARIARHEIDVLVDLSGHTMGGRMGLFARKPAPVQVNWLGYPNTTGLPAMDYRFTDAFADPPGLTEALHSETLYRLPHFLCYRPEEDSPDVCESPCVKQGMVTFGCFNNTNKINAQVISAWAEILRLVPDSRLVLKTIGLGDADIVTAFLGRFHKDGVEPRRIECYPALPGKYDHLATYGMIDLSLDPFPYNGTTTTFESLWMGVPVVTLEGRVHAARVGVSIMSGIGLPDLIAPSIEAYVELAASLAGDPARLAAYRQGMRARLRASPLMNAQAFTASVETAYFEMMRERVGTESVSAL